jgi:pyruvate dehydrogenase E2 component (dihydrolipoamide acetyltransferase)
VLVAVEIVMPRLSDSMEEGTIVSWLVSEGDLVRQGQPLVEIETDKATVTFESETEGVILALKVSDGACVPVGMPIAVVGQVGEGLAVIGGRTTRQAHEPAHAQRAVAAAAGGAGGAPGGAGAVPARGSGRIKASPLARRRAAELGLDLAALSGSGPQGRVTRADVDRALAAGGAIAGNGGAAVAAETTESAKGEATVLELSRLQQTVARRMSESRATVPDIELRAEVDMGEAVALREKFREVADPAPSINDFVVKAAALALRESPRVNGAYRDGAVETYARINVGIAVAAENALVVPTIFDADQKSLGEIGRAARELADRVRDGSITPAELSGGTFTVSNLGMFGVDSFSAVINPPQAAILAVGSLKRRPIVDEPSGELVVRPTLILTLACDHRILYGVDGARFLSRVRELLERPHTLLL